MCYHPKRRRAVITENSQPSLQTRLKSPHTLGVVKELNESLELEPQVPLDTPKTKASINEGNRWVDKDLVQTDCENKNTVGQEEEQIQHKEEPRAFELKVNLLQE